MISLWLAIPLGIVVYFGIGLLLNFLANMITAVDEGVGVILTIGWPVAIPLGIIVGTGGLIVLGIADLIKLTRTSGQATGYRIQKSWTDERRRLVAAKKEIDETLKGEWK